MIILSRIPCHPDKRIVRTSEVLFFDATERMDIPPQRPSLVLLLHDRAMCTTCGKEICTCPNAIGIARGTMLECQISTENTLSNGKSDPTTRNVRSWEDRARIVAHGNKRGLLSIVYGGSFAGSFSQMTVRQAYVSICEHQDAIAQRIQQHLARLLCRIPPISSTEIRKPGPYIVALPGSGAVQEGAVAFNEDASSQSPTSFAQKGVSWLDSAAHALERHSDAKQEQKNDSVTRGCCSGSATGVRHNCSSNSRLGQGPSSSKTNEPNSGESGAKYCQPSTAEVTSEKGSASLGSGIITACAPTPGATSAQGKAPQISLCGPEKAGKDCDCSAEKTQDPILARILNSGTDQMASNAIADTPSSGQSMFPTTGDTNDFRSIRNLNPTALLAKMSTQKDHQVELVPPESNNYDSVSPSSVRCGASATTVPSPMPESTSVQGEPAFKRPKIDSTGKLESFGFGPQAGWHGSHEDRECFLSIPPWPEAGGTIERPLSALGRAMGVTTGNSPFALVSPRTNTPTPPAISNGDNRFALGKTSHTDFDFTFDPLQSPIPRLNEPFKRPDNNANIDRQTEITDGSGLRQALQSADTKISDVHITGSASASGFSCDICGIKFRKRSNKIRHIQTVHNRVKQFECDICGAKFGLKADLGRHRYRIHESRAFQCDSCGKSFVEHEQLKQHIRVIHEEDSKPWECKTCLIRFGRKSTLTRHEQTVHQQTRFACRFCKKSYSQKFDAIRHERKVHDVDDKAGSSAIK